jgi:hypothetical protein
MGAVITLITSFSFPGKRDADFELTPGMNTVGDLLRHLGTLLEFSLLSPQEDDIDDDLEVSLNGRGLWAHGTGLDTPLKNGDTLEIYMLALGGG